MTFRQNFASGTPWEDKVGYSRAVRVGNVVYVSGTTASDENGQVYGIGDPYEQAMYILRKIERALQQAGAEMGHVVRTRSYVTDISQWKAVGRAHSTFFDTVRPCSTMVEVSKLVSPEHLVEIEVEAVIPPG